MKKLPIDNRYILQRSDKYCAAALVCLSIAIFMFSVLEFLISPASVFGIVIASLGVLLMCGTIYFFVRCALALKHEQERSRS
jgi:hypothetical protein